MTNKVTSRASRRHGGRPGLSPAEREAADAARADRIAALHERIGEQVEALAADPAWRAMLETAARFHAYSLNNQLLIALGAAAQGFTPSRVAGFTTWKALGRSVVKGSRGLAILAPCTYRTAPAAAGQDTAGGGATQASAAATGGEGEGTGPEAPAGARVLRGFRVAHVFDISQTEGDPLPEVRPELLTGNAPAALWDALAAQVTAHGYTLSREDCGDANGVTDPAARAVRVRPDVDQAQAVKTLAHELGHLECGHVADGYDYTGCRGRAEAEAESVAYIVTAWAGLDAGAYTVPYVAGWSGGDAAVVRAAATTVTAAARRILDRLDDPDAATEDNAAEDDAAEGGAVAPQTEETGAAEQPGTRARRSAA
jgi:hypothetical protein